MRVYVSMDAEGISGIYKLSQVMSTNKEFEKARRLMASDVNAAADGAFRGGATEFFVNDAHNNGDNLIIDQLDPRIKLCSGKDRPLTMAQGAELKFDVALLIGYHARKGSKGVISHSYAYGSMVEMKLNGKIISEYELIGYVCGYFDTPVIFLSGDDIVTADAKTTIPGIYTVQTKECIGNGSAICLHPKVTSKMISNTVKMALENYKADGIKPMDAGKNPKIEVRYSAESQARLAMGAPKTKRLGESTVEYTGKDYLEVYRHFVIGTSLAGNFRDDAALYK